MVIAYNVLEHLPPQIVQLVNLRELNIKNNRLRYLPAEILDMKLTVLELANNPWVLHSEIDPEARIDDGDASETSVSREQYSSQRDRLTRRVVTETSGLFTIASLGEYCLRTLLAPFCPDLQAFSAAPQLGTPDPSTRPACPPKQTPPWPHYKSNLHAHADLPLFADPRHPPHFLDALRECLPGTVARPDQKSHLQGHGSGSHSRAASLHEELFSPAGSQGHPAQAPPSQLTSSQTSSHTTASQEVSEEQIQNSIGLCLSPDHVPLNSRVFTAHAEERYTWEAVVAGVDLGPFGPVPVLWRGCNQGCLRFLDALQDDTGDTYPEPELGTAFDAGDGMEVDLDLLDEEYQSDDGFGVVQMNISGGLDSFD